MDSGEKLPCEVMEWMEQGLALLPVRDLCRHRNLC